MYSRLITKTPDTLIKNGAPVFGTFSDAPENLDIRGVRRPFASLPFPVILTNAFIRSNIACVFNTGRFICSIDMFKALVFGFIEIVFWDAETHKKNAYRRLIVPWQHFIPYSLKKGRWSCLNRKRRLRISWDRKRGFFSFVCSLKGDGARPDIKGAFTANLSVNGFCEVTCVLPSPVTRRCKAVHKIAFPIKGVFNFSPRGKGFAQQESCQFNEGAMLFDAYRAYYKIPTINEFAYGVGRIESHAVSFSIVSSSLDAVNPDDYNENSLFVDGTFTPLPPVKITYPFGLTGKWIIQDTESMVDLSFSPATNHSRTHSLFILSTRYNVLFGFFNGILLTRDGGQIALKDFPGIAKKHVLRL
ncbi:MAG: DUF2804 domain-containing protein [Treponemataceae bacterium]|nr:MAG: DUF2804 domain-containing protein [Treponemataceae bacterium]